MNTQPAFFFDLDDTLYDHFSPFLQAVRHVLAPDETSVDITRLFHTMRSYGDLLWPRYDRGEVGLDELKRVRMEQACDELGIELDRERSLLFQQDYLERQSRFGWFPGARELLGRLIAAGYVVGIITNGPEDYQWAKIRGLGLDRIIPAERIFISGAVGLAKPDPAIFAHANRMTGTEASASVYIGDSWEKDIAGALAAGWQAGWFNERGLVPAAGHKPHFEFSRYAELDL
ncbi:HAD family hydrolase [Paenibacillus sp. MMS20-IR301]|uniref:HAD family hydrolase n=1 Tax=Paenibacillus sp. MMS20-IR301 TaxID=2895946 RepID=UPI0028EF0680|nr:HAD family hydrolase [Paenibacillus sp. MMS20-IR301]WNS46968.1 HAD family hydrolase [Paenibacillus sp. MMS20-IR301]